MFNNYIVCIPVGLMYKCVNNIINFEYTEDKFSQPFLTLTTPTFCQPTVHFCKECGGGKDFIILFVSDQFLQLGLLNIISFYCCYFASS